MERKLKVKTKLCYINEEINSKEDYFYKGDGNIDYIMCYMWDVQERIWSFGYKKNILMRVII